MLASEEVKLKSGVVLSSRLLYELQTVQSLTLSTHYHYQCCLQFRLSFVGRTAMNLRGHHPQGHTARDPLHPAPVNYPGFKNQHVPLSSSEPPLTVNKKINKSCLECRRRKIRCDGNQPCEKCIYYQIPLCQFKTRKQRKFSSHR